ncbi:MAG: hypothetical protein ACYTG2_07135 [Planctomycetota bacterium]
MPIGRRSLTLVGMLSGPCAWVGAQFDAYERTVDQSDPRNDFVSVLAASR